MKAIKILFFVIIAAAFFSSCKKKNAGPDFEGMAKEMCTCGKDMVQLYEKQQSLQASGDTEGLTALLGDLTGVMTKFEACFGGLEAKYKEIDENPEYQKKAEEALKKHCPDLAKVMEQGGR